MPESNNVSSDTCVMIPGLGLSVWLVCQLNKIRSKGVRSIRAFDLKDLGYLTTANHITLDIDGKEPQIQIHEIIDQDTRQQASFCYMTTPNLNIQGCTLDGSFDQVVALAGQPAPSKLTKGGRTRRGPSKNNNDNFNQ